MSGPVYVWGRGGRSPEANLISWSMWSHTFTMGVTERAFCSVLGLTLTRSMMWLITSPRPSGQGRPSGYRGIASMSTLSRG